MIDDFFFLFSKQYLVYNEKKELLCHLIVYLLINYFAVVWMTEGKLSIRRKSCKTCKNTFKSPKIYAFAGLPLPPGIYVWRPCYKSGSGNIAYITPEQKKSFQSIKKLTRFYVYAEMFI